MSGWLTVILEPELMPHGLLPECVNLHLTLSLHGLAQPLSLMSHGQDTHVPLQNTLVVFVGLPQQCHQELVLPVLQLVSQ